MQYNLSFPAEIENAIRRRAAAAGQDVESFVKQVIAEEVAEEIAARPPRSQEEFMAGLREMVQRHGICDGRFDDSRESIYAGRGE